MKYARIIYNPTSGKEAFKKELSKVLRRFEASGYETSVHATTGEGDAGEEVKSAIARHFDVIVVAGGDGTINEVVAGMADQDNRPKLGIIPTGTTNDFARALGIPQHIMKAVAIILDDHSMLLDIGKAKGHYFINIAGGGKLTELTFDVPIKLKKMLGRMAYYVKGIQMLPFIKSTSVRLEYDGEVLEDDIMLFFVSNTNSVSGFEKLAPDAKLDDGYFDLLVLKKTNLFEFVRLVLLAFKGKHLEHNNMIYKQAKHIKVESAEEMKLNIDGEYGGLFPGEIYNIKQHIELFVPKEFIEKND